MKFYSLFCAAIIVLLVLLTRGESQGLITLNAPEQKTNEECIPEYSSPQPIDKDIIQINITFEEYIQMVHRRGDVSSEYRRILFEKNLLYINEHNSHPNRTYDLGVNDFLHLSEEEFVQTHTGLKKPTPKIVLTLQTTPTLQTLPSEQPKPLLTSALPQIEQNEESAEEIPSQNLITLSEATSTEDVLPFIDFVDWSCHSAKLNVPNQGVCSASYAFAVTQTIAAIESIYDQNHFHISLSPQHLISSKPVTMLEEGREDGCTGSSFEQTIQFIKKQGVHYEWNYPYKNGNFEEALPPEDILSIFKTKTITSWNLIPDSCAQVLKAVEKKPVVAGIYVDKNLQLYKKGLYKGEEKDSNHAVMIVGFNKDFGFWSKNSWGGKWGEEGYFWVDTQQNAGICSHAINLVVNDEMEQLNPQKCCSDRI